MKNCHVSLRKAYICIAAALYSAALLLSAGTVEAAGNESPGGNEGRITVLDYGNAKMNGDAVLVESDGHYILMDTGYTDMQKDIKNSKVIQYLKSRDIHELDLYLSHYHNDHYYLMTTIMKDDYFTVGTVYLPNADDLLAYSSKENKDAKWYKDLTKNICVDGEEWGRHSYSKIQKALRQRGLKSVVLHKGDSFSVGDALFEVLWQEENVKKPKPSNEKGALQMINDASLVTRVTIGGVRYLTAGDIYKDVEEKMINAGVDLRADIVKTNHHSNQDTSNSPEFYQAVGAAWAFGTGEGSETCRMTAEKFRTNYVNMKNNGQITFEIDRGEITMFAERNLRKVNRLYTDSSGKEQMKTFWFNIGQRCFFRDHMIPKGGSFEIGAARRMHRASGRKPHKTRHFSRGCSIASVPLLFGFQGIE